MEAPITVDTETLKALIKESVREVMKEEWFRAWQRSIPDVSDAEQAELEQILGSSPPKYEPENAIDMTDWLNDEG